MAFRIDFNVNLTYQKLSPKNAYPKKHSCRLELTTKKGMVHFTNKVLFKFDQPNANTRLVAKEPPYALETITDRSFDVHVKIYFKSGIRVTPFEFFYYIDLNLNKPVSKATQIKSKKSEFKTLEKKSHVISNPPADLIDNLIKGGAVLIRDTNVADIANGPNTIGCVRSYSGGYHKPARRRKNTVTVNGKRKNSNTNNSDFPMENSLIVGSKKKKTGSDGNIQMTEETASKFPVEGLHKIWQNNMKLYKFFQTNLEDPPSAVVELILKVIVQTKKYELRDRKLHFDLFEFSTEAINKLLQLIFD